MILVDLQENIIDQLELDCLFIFLVSKEVSDFCTTYFTWFVFVNFNKLVFKFNYLLVVNIMCEL